MKKYAYTLKCVECGHENHLTKREYPFSDSARCEECSGIVSSKPFLNLNENGKGILSGIEEKWNNVRRTLNDRS